MTRQHVFTNRRLRAIVIGVLAVLLLFVTVSWPDTITHASDGDVVPGVVTVVLQNGADERELLGRLARASWSRDREVLPGRVWRVGVPAGLEEPVAAIIAGWPGIVTAAPESIVRMPVPGVSTTALARPSFRWATSITPNDYWFSSQWAHTVGRAPGAWELTRGIATIGIGIIDSGFDVGHPDAPVNLVLGTDYVSGGTVSADPNGHGTHVAGIIAAAFDNGIGVAGVAPGVTIYVDRILDATGSGADSDLVAAIIHQANDARIRVISLSLGGGTTGSTTDNAAIRYALDQGKIVVAATGNSGSAVLFPASYPGVIPVGAIGSTLAVTSYSNFGLSLQQYGVVAPGGDGSSSSTKIISTYARTLTSGTGQAYGYKSISGTSMATLYISGVIGLMLSINPNLTRDQVMSILRGSARVGTTSTLPDVRYGAGIVDASAAVGTVQALLSPVATLTATTTSTSTRTPTSTATSTPTATPTRTVALIQANEETTTPSVTATATTTATASSTATAAQTSTSTATQTTTPTSSAIASLTVSPSAFATVTATTTPSPSPSPTSTVPATRTSNVTSTAQATSISTPAAANSRRISFPLAPSVVRLP